MVAARSGNIEIPPGASSIVADARVGLAGSGGAGSGEAPMQRDAAAGRGSAREARSLSMLHNVWIRLEGGQDHEWVHAGTGAHLRDPPESGSGGARFPCLWSQEQYMLEKNSILETGKGIFLSARSTCIYRLPSAGVVRRAICGTPVTVCLRRGFYIVVRCRRRPRVSTTTAWTHSGICNGGRHWGRLRSD